MRVVTGKQVGFGRLEVLLVLALLALSFQLFPSLWFTAVWAADVRNWSRAVWMTLNIAVVVCLFGFRFGPELYREWRGRAKHVSGSQVHREKQLSIKEERELYERLREARKRQVI